MDNKLVFNSIADMEVVDPSKKNLMKKETADERIARQKQEFFTLLVTQLKNQDPTSPMDTNEMTAQVFSINQVEQLLEINKSLQTQTKTLETSMINQSVSYIGKNVVYKGDQVQAKDGVAEFVYRLDRRSPNTVITIKDNFGMSKVADLPVPGEAGINTFRLNLTEKDLQDNPSGRYTFKVESVNDDLSKAPVTTLTNGIIDSLQNEEGKQYFMVNGKKLTHDDVVQFRANSN